MQTDELKRILALHRVWLDAKLDAKPGGARADLSEANLSWADLSRADLSEANLSGADLSGADLSGANLSGADLSRADLSGANLSRADLSGADVPVVADLDGQVLCAVTASPKALDMGTWHQCETTHCRAGWAITLAGEKGRALEASVGSSAAGALIYAASRPGKPVPDFLCGDDTAMESIISDAIESVAKPKRGKGARA